MMDSYAEEEKPIKNRDYIIYNIFKQYFDKTLEGLKSGTKLEKVNIKFDELPENFPIDYFDKFKGLDEDEKNDLKSYFIDALNEATEKILKNDNLNLNKISRPSYDLFAGYINNENSKQQLIDFLIVVNDNMIPQESNLGGKRRKKKTVRRKKRKTVRRRKTKTVRKRRTKQ